MKAVIFDMDGVLILSEKINYYMYSTVAKELGCKLSKKDYNKYFAGRTAVEGVKDFLESNGLDISKTSEVVRKSRKIKKDKMLQNFKETISLRNGTLKMLKSLKEEFTLAIATSTEADFAKIITTKHNIHPYFSVILSAKDITKGKPNPEIYLKTAKKLGISPHNCIVVEDASNGIEAAKNAGMKCIAIKMKGFEKRNLSQADYIIKNFIELTPSLINKVFSSRK